jgi:hypothetical protein
VIVQGTSVGLDVHALSVLAHAVDEETGKIARARLCPDHGEVLECRTCRFSFHLANHDSPASASAEFSSKWRTGFSHLRGESLNRTVVQIADRTVSVTARKPGFSELRAQSSEGLRGRVCDSDSTSWQPVLRTSKHLCHSRVDGSRTSCRSCLASDLRTADGVVFESLQGGSYRGESRNSVYRNSRWWAITASKAGPCGHTSK